VASLNKHANANMQQIFKVAQPVLAQKATTLEVAQAMRYHIWRRLSDLQQIQGTLYINNKKFMTVRKAMSRKLPTVMTVWLELVRALMCNV